MHGNTSEIEGIKREGKKEGGLYRKRKKAQTTMHREVTGKR
jgi:hypothetical protein